MSKFHRSGHWRTSAYGDTHWVRGHNVERDAWVETSALYGPAKRITRPRSFESFTTPNARCPVCSASVFFYVSPYGGRVFFDNLGPPWPKHPCTDNGRPPRLEYGAPQTNAVWQMGGLMPFTVDGVLWGKERSRVLGHFVREPHGVGFEISMDTIDADRIGPLAFLPKGAPKEGAVQTLDRDANSLALTYTGLQSNGSQLLLELIKARKKDCRLFMKRVAADWPRRFIIESDRSITFGVTDRGLAFAKFFDGSFASRHSDSFVDFAYHRIVKYRKDRLGFPAAWSPIGDLACAVGHRKSLPAAIEGSFNPNSIETDEITAACNRRFFRVAAEADIFEMIHSIDAEKDDGIVQRHALSLINKRHYTITSKAIHAFAMNCGVGDLYAKLRLELKSNGFFVGYHDHFSLKGIEIYAWLAYSSSKDGLYVTIKIADGLDVGSVTGPWPGRPGRTQPPGLLSSDPATSQIARWLRSREDVVDFIAQVSKIVVQEK